MPNCILSCTLSLAPSGQLHYHGCPFSNIEPPALRCRAATDKLIMQAECHRDWPLYDEVFYPPSLCLEGRGGEGKIKVGEGTREPGKRGVRR